MIKYLVDSDRLIDYLNSRTDARAVLTPFITNRELATSIIVLGEIYEGILRDPKRELKQSALNDVLAVVETLGIDESTARTFAVLRADLRAAGQIINDHDIWIAATALEHNLTLITRDKHFERIAGLKRHV